MVQSLCILGTVRTSFDGRIFMREVFSCSSEGSRRGHESLSQGSTGVLREPRTSDKFIAHCFQNRGILFDWVRYVKEEARVIPTTLYWAIGTFSHQGTLSIRQ
jgi:hypothetical protein